jgi:hypothetical protein
MLDPPQRSGRYQTRGGSFGTTRLLPKILDLPDQVWINKPEQEPQIA